MSQPLSTQALVVRSESKSLSLEDIVIVDLQPDEILVQIVTSGICHTDLLAIDGILPMPGPGVLGHEGSTGRIKRVGEGVHHLNPGDNIMLSYSSCGSCNHCRSQHTSYCESLQARNSSGARPDGSCALMSTSGERLFGNWFGQSSFSKYAVVDTSCAVRLAPEVDLATLPPMGCGLMTGAGAVFNTLDVQSGAGVAIFGVGAVGLSAVMAAKHRGAHPIIAVDRIQERLDLALELGATHVINSTQVENVAGKIRQDTDSVGVRYALDCTGAATVIRIMMDSLALRGKGASVGMPSSAPTVELDILSHLCGGKQYIGSMLGDSSSQVLIPYLLELNKKGEFPVERLVTYYQVKDYEIAFTDVRNGRAVKAVLRWGAL
ncbi:NAD(P)-dependent alcohol dehydrogenase [Aspergillus aculeatinus CBS 121060]|uniref:Alcohol dehydrogenase n=1 Tax=Aspergillus aculeatinus CBS 121060 TaxID=1448322 RepID=A0ACD1HM93_9EURO|nr:alcohol dehydrogenase [Aspergillus aculeatinus CBS 121060]RAH74696.1 alcohol dehydrogenase [Aspergillus aculeatinus CBS 121060]